MTMLRDWRPRLAAVFCAALFFAAAVSAADKEPPVQPAAGQLLVAAAAMQDPRFGHTVILLVRHDAKGAFGIIINRPVAERPLSELLGAIRDNDSPDVAPNAPGTPGDGKAEPVAGTIRVFFGGPVEPQRGFVIHSADYYRTGTLAAGDGLAMTATKDVLRDIAQHKGPAKYLLALGYTGWGPDQLEAEMARHDWFTAPAEPGLVFDAARETVWDKALASRTREL
ncbi:MAG: YqgE/AlgH family protein [Thiohalocapsa sp.]